MSETSAILIMTTIFIGWLIIYFINEDIKLKRSVKEKEEIKKEETKKELIISNKYSEDKTDILFLNKTEKVNVTLYGRSILIKNEQIDINIDYDEIFNYTLEKEYISLYIYSRYSEKVEEIINLCNTRSNNYIVVKLYYNDSTNIIVQHFDQLIKEHYKEEVEKGYIFAEKTSKYIFDLKCGFDNIKISKINSDISGGFSVTLCEKDYYNRLKKSFFVPNLLWVEYENIVSVELTEKCLNVLFYFDEYSSLEKTSAAEFYATATDKLNCLKVELYGEKDSLLKFKEEIEPHIHFTSFQELRQKKEKSAEAQKEYEEKNIKEQEKTLQQSISQSNTAYGWVGNILFWVGAILFVLVLLTDWDSLMYILEILYVLGYFVSLVLVIKNVDSEKDEVLVALLYTFFYFMMGAILFF